MDYLWAIWIVSGMSFIFLVYYLTDESQRVTNLKSELDSLKFRLVIQKDKLNHRLLELSERINELEETN